jgi:hypothetical protein
MIRPAVKPTSVRRHRGWTCLRIRVRLRNGSSPLNYAVDHDRYQRTPDAWKFAERVMEIKFVDNLSAGRLGAPRRLARPNIDLAPGLTRPRGVCDISRPRSRRQLRRAQPE